MASEQVVTDSETTRSDADTTNRDRNSRSSGNSAFTTWLASSTIRFGLVLVGIVLLLAAVGQLSGIDILGSIGAVLTTGVGLWLLVAVVAIGLIGIAMYGYRGQST